MLVITETAEELFFLTSNFKHILQRRPSLKFLGHYTFEHFSNNHFSHRYIEGAWVVYFLYHNFFTVKKVNNFISQIEENYSGNNVSSFKKSWIYFDNINFSLGFHALWIETFLADNQTKHTKTSIKFLKKHMDDSVAQIPKNDLRNAHNLKQNVSHYMGVAVNKKTGKSRRVFFKLKEIPGDKKWVVECIGHW